MSSEAATAAAACSPLTPNQTDNEALDNEDDDSSSSSSSSSSSDSEDDDDADANHDDEGFGAGFSSGGSDFDSDGDGGLDDDDEDDDGLGDPGSSSPIRSLVPGNMKGGAGSRIAFTNIAGVRTRMDEMIADTTDILAIGKAEAEILLLYYKWNVRLLQEQWFDSQGKVRQKCGFAVAVTLPKPATTTSSNASTTVAECDACGDDEVEVDKMHTMACGHGFCKDCWLGYLTVKVESGPGCVFAKCMETGCEQSVLRSTWEFADAIDPSKGILKAFERYIVRSYCNENAHISWCPSPGCTVIIEYKGGGAQDIVCRCRHKFCFRCKEEAHRPANCTDVKKWHTKNTSESENVTWMIANTKECPKCGRPIEKNQGCNHMTCHKNSGGCGHEFCWLCMGDWSAHGSATGGFYKCNKYEDMKTQRKVVDMENKRKTAKSEINKYKHYLERFMNHKTSMTFAEATLAKIEKGMEHLQTQNDYKITEVQFLKDAAEEVTEAHRVLRWTYVFGYYLNDPHEKNLFEFLQEDLEKNCDHLHELIEQPLDRFFGCDEACRQQFHDYRSAITNHFTVTRKFMQNLLDGIDNGLTSAPVGLVHKRAKFENPSRSSGATKS